MQALSYLLAFGPFVGTGVYGLLGGTAAGAAPYTGLLFVLLLAGFVIAPLTLLIANRWLGLSSDALGLRGGHPFPLGFLGATGLSFLMMTLGFQVMYLFPEWPSAAQSGETDLLADFFRGMHGGVVEELLLLALPIAITARLRWPLWAQLLLLVAMRVPFHLYYGPAAVLLCLVWIAGILFTYRKIWLVWPAMAAHVVYNLGHYSGVPPVLHVVVNGVLYVLGLTAAVLLLVRRGEGDGTASEV